MRDGERVRKNDREFVYVMFLCVYMSVCLNECVLVSALVCQREREKLTERWCVFVCMCYCVCGRIFACVSFCV